MRPLRVAVIGLGWWGRQLVTSIDDSDSVDVVAAVEPNTGEAQSFARRHGMALYPDLEPVLADRTIEGVLVVTPHALHEQQVIDAASAGKHVFCEKPLALDSAAAQRMLSACTSRGLTLGVGHERRYEGALERMVAMAATGDLGTLLHMECNWSHDLFVGAPGQTWRSDPAQAPAGTLTALGVHITDFFQSVGGRVAEVTATAADRSPRFPADDIITIQLRFESGMTGVLTNLASTPFYSRITLFGDAGWVEAREWSNVDVPEPALLTSRGTDGELHTQTFAPTNTVRRNVEAWAAAARGTAAYRFTDDQLIHNVEILEAIVRSATGTGSGHVGPV